MGLVGKISITSKFGVRWQTIY